MQRLFCYGVGALIVKLFQHPLPVVLILMSLLIFNKGCSYIDDKIDDLTTNPQGRKVTVVSSALDTGPYPSIGATLKLNNTLKRPYKANAAICSVVGPMHYNNSEGWYAFPRYAEHYRRDDFVGDRRLLLALFPESYVTNMGVINAHTPNLYYKTDKQVEYLATTPTDVLTAVDKIEWCQVGENLSDLAHSLGLTLTNGVIDNRLQWLSGGKSIIPSDTVNLSAAQQREVQSGFIASQEDRS